MRIKQDEKTGDFYLARVVRISTIGRGGKGKRSKKPFRDWWIIKWGGYSGVVPIHSISFPKEWVGKKVRFKVEVIK